VALGEHSGENHLWWRAGRRGWRDLRDEVGGDPVRHLVAHLRLQLGRPGQELTCPLGLRRTEPR
jgi:hypothetical protein